MPELTCIRLLNTEAPAGPLADAVRAINAGHGGSAVHVVDATSFSQVPNAPFAYWVDEKVRRLFKELSAFESEGRTARQGLATADDFRFVRCWWEVPNDSGWKPFAKGGGVSPFYADVFMRVNWFNRGSELGSFDSARVQNVDFYFKPGCFQTLRSSRFAPHLTPRGCVFSHNGFQFFADESELIWLLGLSNSKFFESLYRLNVGNDEAPLFIAGVMQRVPVPAADNVLKSQISNFTRSAWSNRRRLAICSERSPFFRQPFAKSSSLREIEKAENKLIADLNFQFADDCKSIENLVVQAYGNVRPNAIGHSSRTRPVSEGDEDEEDSADGSLGQATFSYLFGLVFGRWSESQFGQSPEEGLPGDPFCEIPSSPPGFAGAVPRLYAVMDESIHDDLVSLVRSRLARLLEAESEAKLLELLNVESLRDYLENPTGFFADHLSVYSKSRRKAPIYWPLSTRSGDFVIWVYYPKLDADSLPRLITEVLDPRLRRLNEELAALAADGKASARKAKLEALRVELAEMRQDFQDLIAKGYKPDLNDGVLITACPLAKYFRLPKFRKDLEDCWKKLSRGDFDWAQLAMSMWPERATEACRRDRSVAIAHGKEDLCPAEPPKAKRGRKKSE